LACEKIAQERLNIFLNDILYDARWIGNHGIGRFAKELQRELPEMESFECRRPPFHPLDPILLGAALLRRNPKLFFSPGYNSPLGWPGRFVFNLHDLNHLRVPENSSAAKRAYYQFIIKPACHRAAFVLTVSEYSKQQICEWAKISEDKIVNVGNGVGFPFEPNGAKYEPGFPYLVYVGSHKAHKNLPRLLQAFAISGLREEVRLILTGDAEPALTKVIHDLHLEREASFAGDCGDEELAALFRGAIALVFPSLYEGFGLPPVEAMACGVPVLTSNLCSLPEVVGDAGILIDPSDTEAIADGMRRLVEDSDLRQTLRQRGLLRASRYTWSRTAAKAATVLRAALSGVPVSEMVPVDPAKGRS
jgi:glycosyltransferase involved in cell wall biosynthesis